MEEASELANYMPLSFKTPKEQEYIEFLWDAFETNYSHGKYQFALLAYLCHDELRLFQHLADQADEAERLRERPHRLRQGHREGAAGGDLAIRLQH
ncbi:MAG: hypothetical protein IPG76_21620 [Acidobacteria bacterium]|nr:hypothetical protein [Acidobacteriota bacterium]